LSEDKDCLNLQEDHAENLDMDHIWVSFWDYLWTMVFVSTSSNCKWIFGILILRLREKLHDKQKRNRYLGKFVQSFESESKSDFRSWIRIFGCWISSLLHKILEVTIASPAMLDGDSKEVKYAERVADFILNSHMVIHFTHMQEEVSGDMIAEIFMQEFPYVVNDLENPQEMRYLQEDFCCILRLSSGNPNTMIAAFIGNRELTAQDTFLLLTLRALSGHVKLHAMANWGVNPHLGAFGKFQRFLKRMGVITVMFNYYGLILFSRIIRLLD